MMLDRSLDHLAAVDSTSLPTSGQAEVLLALERAGAKHTATRGRVLAAFAAQAGYEDDGHRSARTWLKWQARITAGAATGPGQPATYGQQASPGHPIKPSIVSPSARPDPLSPATRDRLRRALLGLAADALSGPGGLAAQLRAALDGAPLATVSLPLDISAATETIPAHLRRAVTTRHPRCAFPGCDQPASVCDIHHLVPRSRGGPTALQNLAPLCGFHHQIAVHRWGWALQLNPDGTTAATSPARTRTRTRHSHGPPPSHGPPSQAA